MSNENNQDYEEILKNSKFAKYVSFGPQNEEKSKLNSATTINNKKEEDRKIDEKFKEVRKKYPNVQADIEAEEHMEHLRDVGEYNRWSLKLVQKWLLGFYQDKFWIQMGIAMMKYKKELNPEDIHLDVCNDFLEGYYFYKDNKITLCANTLTNYEKPKKFHFAVKRHLVLMYDNIRSKDFNPKNCRHLACSEIRAANLSGYCEGEYSFFNAYVNSEWNTKRNYDCVKSKANEHMITYYDHCAADSMKYINDVWAKCYIDKSPIKDFSKEKNYI